MNIYKELRRLAIKMDADVSNTHNIKDIVSAMSVKLEGNSNGPAIADAAGYLAKAHSAADTLRGLTLDTDISASEDLFGKVVSDFQTNMSVSGDGVSGTLFYVEGYSAYSGEEANGNYLVVHASVPDVEGVTIVVTVTDKRNDSTTWRTVVLDPDGILIFRVADKRKMRLTFTAIKEGFSPYSRTYVLDGLNCETNPLASLLVTASDDLVVSEATQFSKPIVSGELETQTESYDVTFTGILKNVTGATITAQVSGEDPVELVSDQVTVSVLPEEKRTLTFKVAKEDYTDYTRTYDLSGVDVKVVDEEVGG